MADDRAGSGDREKVAYRPLTPRQRQIFEDLAARAAANPNSVGTADFVGETDTTGAPSPQPYSEPITPFERFLNQIFRESGVIRRAPLLSAATAVVIAVAIWFIFDWRYGGQIDSLRDQNDLLRLKLENAEDALVRQNRQPRTQ